VDGLASLTEVRWPIKMKNGKEYSDLYVIDKQRDYAVSCDFVCLQKALSRYTISISSHNTLFETIHYLITQNRFSSIKSSVYEIILDQKTYYFTWGEKLLILWLSIFNVTWNGHQDIPKELFAFVIQTGFVSDRGFPIGMPRYDKLNEDYAEIEEFWGPIFDTAYLSCPNSESPAGDSLFLFHIVKINLYLMTLRQHGYRDWALTGSIRLLLTVESKRDQPELCLKTIQDYTSNEQLKTTNYHSWEKRNEYLFQTICDVHSIMSKSPKATCPVDCRMTYSALFQWIQSRNLEPRGVPNSSSFLIADVSWLTYIQVQDLLLYHCEYMILRQIQELKPTLFGLIDTSHEDIYYETLFESPYLGGYYLTDDKFLFFGYEQRIREYQQFIMIPRTIAAKAATVRFASPIAALEWFGSFHNMDETLLTRISIFFLPNSSFYDNSIHAMKCKSFYQLLFNKSSTGSFLDTFFHRTKFHCLLILCLLPFVDYQIDNTVLNYYKQTNSLNKLYQIIKEQYAGHDVDEHSFYPANGGTNLLACTVFDHHIDYPVTTIGSIKWIYSKIMGGNEMFTFLLFFIFENIQLILPFDQITSFNIFPYLDNFISSSNQQLGIFVNHKSLNSIIITKGTNQNILPFKSIDIKSLCLWNLKNLNSSNSLSSFLVGKNNKKRKVFSELDLNSQSDTESEGGVSIASS